MSISWNEIFVFLLWVGVILSFQQDELRTCGVYLQSTGYSALFCSILRSRYLSIRRGWLAILTRMGWYSRIIQLVRCSFYQVLWRTQLDQSKLSATWRVTVVDKILRWLDTGRRLFSRARCILRGRLDIRLWGNSRDKANQGAYPSYGPWPVYLACSVWSTVDTLLVPLQLGIRIGTATEYIDSCLDRMIDRSGLVDRWPGGRIRFGFHWVRYNWSLFRNQSYLSWPKTWPETWP